MKKRISAALLALSLALALFPAAVLAADNGFEIKDGKLTKYTGPGGVVSIPEGVTSTGVHDRSGTLIWHGAFEGNKEVAIVNFPDSLTAIGNRAFYGCTSLAKLTLTSGITSIGTEAFCDCEALTGVVIPENISSLGGGVFYSCGQLSSVTIAEGQEPLAIPSKAFAKCGALTSVSLSNRVTALGANCFQDCVGLQSVTIPKSVQVISAEAFKNCSGLTSVTILNPDIVISKNAFTGTSLRNVYFGGSEAQWSGMALDKEGNSKLTGAAVHYNTAGVNPNPDPGANPTPGDGKEVHFPRVNVYNQGQFTDVPANQWYTDGVKQAFEMGLMVGDSDTTFAPQSNVTVAQAIAMAARLHSIYTTGAESFQPSGAWYQVYLDYALQNSIISSAYYNSDVTRNATRAQFAEIFANALPEEALSPINTVSKIPDVPANAYYRDHVYKLYRAGILSGSDVNGTFSPDSYITRQEAAAIVSRMAESSCRVKFSL